tara:strand:+ start:48173 stop:48382 length:210 start_codon:yes stop_codon:yes gene_type:complete
MAKYMQLKEWKKREFSGKAWDNRTIKGYIAKGRLIGILNGRGTLIREDQTLDQLSAVDMELDELIRDSA